MKRFLVLSLAFCLAVFMVACAPTVPAAQSQTPAVSQSASQAAASSSAVKTDDGKILIGVAFSTIQDESWRREKDIMIEYAKTLPGNVEVIFQDANNDINTQVSQVENMISQGIDALIVGPTDCWGIVPATDQCMKNGIPVLSYRLCAQTTNQTAMVGFDLTALGEAHAQTLVDKVAKGNYAILQGDAGTSAVQFMHDGVMKVLKPYIDKGDIKVVFDQNIDKWASENALAAMENCLTANKNMIDAVICFNDNIANGAIQALSAQGLAGKVAVSGMEAAVDACKRIVEGTQTSTIYFPHEPFAKAGIDAAVKLAKGEKIDAMLNGQETLAETGEKIPRIEGTFVAVTKDNILDSVVKDGIITIDELYANVPKDQWPKQ